MMQEARSKKHSILEDVIKAATGINIDTLIFGHFSSRYLHEEIDDCIKKCCKDYNVRFKIFRVLPERYINDIISSPPINC